MSVLKDEGSRGGRVKEEGWGKKVASKHYLIMNSVKSNPMRGGGGWNGGLVI